MVKYQMSADGSRVVVEMTARRPSIYLDQWMWTQLAKNESVRDKFVEVMRKADGSIIYSWTVIYEIGGLTDRDQLEQISEIMDQFDYGFLETDPLRVISREKSPEVDDGTFRIRNPAMDTDFVRFLYRIHDPLKGPRMSDILWKLDEGIRAVGRRRYRELSEGFRTTSALIEAGRTEQVLRNVKKAKAQRILSRQCPPFTADILESVINFVILNKDMKMEPSEWLDVFHMVVPAAYCDAVLLDKRWTTFVRQNIQLESPDIAKICSPRELESFWAFLSSFNESPSV